MKQKEASLRTKNAFAASLKRFMKKKPLSKITVSDIVSDCDVNRKTFYYHFSDIYDLLRWMLEQETVNVMRKYDLMVDYEEVILYVLRYIKENAYIINCAYDTLGREGLKAFLYRNFIDLSHSFLESAAKERGLEVDPGYENFLAQIYTEGLAAMVLVGVDDPEGIDEKKTLQYFSAFIRSSVPAVLKAGLQSGNEEDGRQKEQ